MLEGVRSNEIIVGAYTDRSGGVCPMLAAHRCGGRTDFLSFARAWDGFTGARGRARRASERELRVLTTHLEASLAQDDEHSDLADAIAEHRGLQDRAEAVRPSEPDRTRNCERAQAGPGCGPSGATTTTAARSPVRRRWAPSSRPSASASPSLAALRYSPRRGGGR